MSTKVWYSMSDEFITIAEAASILGVRPVTVRYYIRQGQLTPYQRLGRRVVLRAEEVREFGRARPLQRQAATDVDGQPPDMSHGDMTADHDPD